MIIIAAALRDAAARNATSRSSLGAPKDRNGSRKILRPPRHPGQGFPYVMRKMAYAAATTAVASHEANAPILKPHIPVMIAAATMVLIATQTPHTRSALR